jgi:hypothetical protein
MIGGRLLAAPDARGAVHVSTRGPLAVGSVVWRDAWGRLTCTVIAKATYDLTPGDSRPLDTPQPLQKNDLHRDDDPSKSVLVPSDLAPFKRAAEVVVVGSAFARVPSASLVARVVVANVDKSIEAFPLRWLASDGALETSPAAARFPLDYEHAAGGPGTENPAGVEVDRADGRGRRALPSLLPPFHAQGGPGARAPTANFGPIAASWPSRASLLAPDHRAWLQKAEAGPLPAAFPAAFFDTAPADQRLDRAIAANERLVLEGLHPEIPRLVMSLAGRAPCAMVATPSPKTIHLAGDLLLVDTDRGICTLTYRGQFEMDEGAAPLRVLVRAALDRELTAEEIRALLESAADDLETTYVEGAEGFALGATPASSPAASLGRRPPPSAQANVPRPVLPFVTEASGAGASPSKNDRALPFRVVDGSSPPPTSDVPAARRAAPPSAPSPVPPPPPVALAPFVPAVAPVTFAPAPPPSWPSAITPPASVAPPPSAEPPARPAVHVARPGSSPKFEDAFGVKGTSDAAAARARATPDEPARPSPRESDAGFGWKPSPPASTSERQAVVSLLCLDEKIVPRVRRSKRFAAALSPNARPRRAASVDAPVAGEAPDDRRDVLRLLSYGKAAEVGEIRGALGDSLDDGEDLDPPILLVAGELRPTFDETEVLRAIVAVVQPVAGADKKILASLAVAQAALGSPNVLRPETSLGIVKQIEQSAASLPLPAGFVMAEVERVLVEGRKYKRRTLLGAARVRADLTLRTGETMPIYVPETVSSSLPMLPSFPIVALCEVTPREDLAEAQDEALVAVALGRVLRSRTRDAR